MKFGDKYELLESLTTGAVETFVANDKVRGERVLVHILDCAPQKPNQSTMDWVLESFRRVAPEPAGPVLETGKYSGTQYAYLVTKPADEAALKGWVRRYELQGRDTQETSTGHPRLVDKPLDIIPPVPVPPVPKESPSVSVTQLLRDFDSQTRPPAGTKAPAASPQPLPNLSIGRESSGLHAAPPWEPVHEPTSTPMMREEPFVDRVADPVDSASKEKAFPSSNFPAASTTSPLRDSSRPGEFTSFFQGPFRGDAPADMPPVSAQPIEPPQKKVGDFTAMFGSVGGSPEQPTPAVEESGMNASPNSFTGMFKDMQAPPRSFTTSTPVPPPRFSPPPPIEPVPPPPQPKESVMPPKFVAPPPPVLPASPPSIPAPPTPQVAVERTPLAKPSALPGEGATGAFRNPAMSLPLAVTPEPQHPGPSPYTQIISREKLMAPSAEAGEEEAAASGNFAAPAMPKVPGAAPPKAPPLKMPPAPKPKIAAPAAPKAPKVPKVDAPAPPPVSYWPLVIVLTVLFFVAVLLIMYFWLKNH